LVRKVQTLNVGQKIVNDDGTPTVEFLRVLQDNGYLADIVQNKKIIGTSGTVGSGTLGDTGDITLSSDAEKILNQIATAQGTLLYKSATTWEGLAPGTAGNFLKTNGAGADPAWVAGGGGDYKLISTATPSGAITVTFNSFGSYKHLKLIGTGRDATAGTGTILSTVRFNSDSGTNYNTQLAYGANTGAGASRSTGATSGLFVEFPKAGDLGNCPGSFELLLPNFSGTTFGKHMIGSYSMIKNATTDFYFVNNSLYWNNTAAITQIDILGVNWVAGSSISLYGLNG